MYLRLRYLAPQGVNLLFLSPKRAKRMRGAGKAVLQKSAQRFFSLRQKRGNNKEYHSTAIFSQRDGRTPAEIRRRKDNRPSFFFRRHLKLPQRRNGRTPAEIRSRKNNRPSCFISRAEKQPQRRNGRTPAKIRRRKNNRPSCFISRAEKQTQRRDGRTPAEIVAKRKTSVVFFLPLRRVFAAKKRANARQNQEKKK